MTLIEFSRDEVLKPLLTIGGIVERRHTLPILSNVLLSKKGDRLILLATDLEIQIQCELKLDGGQDFEITIAAKKLQEILRAMPESARISLEQQDQRITIRSGKSRFNIQSLSAAEYPTLNVDSAQSSSFSVQQKQLKTLLSKVQYAMANQDIRYYLNGLYFVTDESNLKLICTDGHRLAYAAEPSSTALGNNAIIVPRKTILETYKLLQASEEPVEITVSPQQIRFEFSGIKIISKIIDGKFPDYNRVIPVNEGKIIALDRLELLGALQRAAILSNDKFRGARFLLEENVLRIICNNSEQEEAEEQVDIAYTGEPLDVGFNINYLLDVLNNIDAPTLLFSFGDHSTSSTLITVPEDQHFKYVVMPMRI